MRCEPFSSSSFVPIISQTMDHEDDRKPAAVLKDAASVVEEPSSVATAATATDKRAVGATTSPLVSLVAELKKSPNDADDSVRN